MLEKTLLMIKPDGVARGLEDEILKRVSQAGLKIVARKKLQLTIEQATEHYAVHKDKPFFPGLLTFITSGSVLACEVQGDKAIDKLRDLMGETNPLEAEPGTIRGDLREENVRTPEGTIKNLVHGSDSQESARRELGIYFS